MMETPLCDFVRDYIARRPLRLHTPGHKGAPFFGAEERDITEVDGADVLYAPTGILRQSEENAAALWQTGRTVYSAEGSSLALRAMLYLTLLYANQKKLPPRILAGRNAHKTFVTAAALLDIETEWLYGGENDAAASCPITPQRLEARLRQGNLPVAVYITSPDYFGQIADVRALAEICHRYGVLLLADNAHGAYLHFLPESRHPIALGADLCCDSAHKTLPVLTGGAYLHLSAALPALFFERADAAMALFASTSPSYLILQSLDAVNRYLADGYGERLSAFCVKAAQTKARLSAAGYSLIGDEPLKITVTPKPYGYTGAELARILSEHGVVCEMYDPDHTVMMLSPEVPNALTRLEEILLSVPQKPPLLQAPPPARPLTQVLPMREALFAPCRTIPVTQCVGRVLAFPAVSCPPAVPVAVCGERLDETALARFVYYGIATCDVLCD